MVGCEVTMFALFEAGNQVVALHHHPRLRRCAPHLGLTMFDLSEVVSNGSNSVKKQ